MMKKEILNCLTWFVNKVAETTTYTNWSNDFKATEVRESTKNLYDELKKHIDITKLTVDEAKELRFKKWDEELPNLWLFPLWIVPLIKEGTVVHDLSGNAFEYYKEKVDNDIRFGCVAYGIMLEK